MKIGFIGCGNMAGAMVGGMIGSGKVDKTDIIVSARSKETLQKRSKALGVATTLDNRKVAEESDVLFFAVKPQFYAEVIREVASCVLLGLRCLHDQFTVHRVRDVWESET